MLETGLADLSKMHKNFRGVLPRASVLALLCAGLAIFPTTVLAQQGTFVFTGSATASYSTLARLNNGTVLFVAAGGSPASPALYDPTTGVFAAAGGTSASLGVGNTATLLNNGMVLIVGGNGLQATLYDPATGMFTATGSMNRARSSATATLLQNGKVLIAGGGTCTAGNGCTDPSAELYNPATGVFTFTGNMVTAREHHTATLLHDGTVLMAGGDGNPVGGPTNSLSGMTQRLELSWMEGPRASPAKIIQRRCLTMEWSCWLAGTLGPAVVSRLVPTCTIPRPRASLLREA